MTLLSVVGDDARTWEIVQDYLGGRRWKIVPETVPAHPFIDPAEIKNVKHRRLIELLIEKWLGRNDMSNDEIADEARVGRSQFYEVRRKYMINESKPERRTDAGL